MVDPVRRPPSLRGRARLVHAVSRPFLAVWNMQCWTGLGLCVVVLTWTVVAMFVLLTGFAG